MTTDNDFEQPFPRPLSGAPVTRLPSARVPSRTLLEGQYVQLEPLDASRHADAMFEASHETDAARKIWNYLPEGPWSSQEEYARVLRQQSASFDRIYYAVKSLDAQTVAGQASFMDMQPLNGTIEIGYIWFGLSLQRTRQATEALFLMLRHAMDDLGYRRMQWRCNSLNDRSRQAARRLGFRFEGVFYNHMIYKGKNRDTAWYSILDDEWPEVREIIQTWLAPSNFDENGRAKTSLSKLMQRRGPSDRSRS